MNLPAVHHSRPASILDVHTHQIYHFLKFFNKHTRSLSSAHLGRPIIVDISPPVSLGVAPQASCQARDSDSVSVSDSVCVCSRSMTPHRHSLSSSRRTTFLLCCARRAVGAQYARRPVVLMLLQLCDHCIVAYARTVVASFPCEAAMPRPSAIYIVGSIQMYAMY